jgi:hypothetical protein
MKIVTAFLSVLIFSSVASSQSPDPAKWMCRNLADSGGFIYQGESIFGTQACRPIPQASQQTQPVASPSASVGSTQVQQPEARTTPNANSTALVKVPTVKPQVTIFEHQTLGESWEDFLRISGSKMNPCKSDKPQAAQWCDTFKKIEAEGNGTLTNSNPSGSVEVVFSEKKLLQVLAIAKADWNKSVAEFTQTYGAPDSQTKNSAIWTFADGGGISVTGLPGNLIRANFYSKDGKPGDQEIPTSPTQQESSQQTSQAQGFAGSDSNSSDYLTPAELQTAIQGSGKGVTITAGSAVGQALVAGMANLNLAQYASVQLFTAESWIAFRARVARQQYQRFNPADLSQAERQRGLVVAAFGGAYGSNAGPQCNSVTRIALISDKGGAVVAEATAQEAASSSWSNAFGASASCNALIAKFPAAEVQRVSSAAEKGEYLIGVFSGSSLLFMYKAKEKYLRELGR